MSLDQSALDAVWDFGDPLSSETALRRARDRAISASERSEWATQIARALGLQEKFAAADALLDGIALTAPEVTTRVVLERGRLRNSEGNAAAAVPLFADAARTARAADLVFLEVDALHMLAIADPVRVEQWTTAALARLAVTSDARTLRWTVSLHNNRGWSHLDRGDYFAALASFESAAVAADRWGSEQQRVWAREAIEECRAALDSSGD